MSDTKDEPPGDAVLNLPNPPGSGSKETPTVTAMSERDTNTDIKAKSRNKFRSVAESIGKLKFGSSKKSTKRTALPIALKEVGPSTSKATYATAVVPKKKVALPAKTDVKLLEQTVKQFSSGELSWYNSVDHDAVSTFVAPCPIPAYYSALVARLKEEEFESGIDSVQGIEGECSHIIAVLAYLDATNGKPQELRKVYNLMNLFNSLEHFRTTVVSAFSDIDAEHPYVTDVTSMISWLYDDADSRNHVRSAYMTTIIKKKTSVEVQEADALVATLTSSIRDTRKKYDDELAFLRTLIKEVQDKKTKFEASIKPVLNIVSQYNNVKGGKLSVAENEECRKYYMEHRKQLHGASYDQYRVSYAFNKMKDRLNSVSRSFRDSYRNINTDEVLRGEAVKAQTAVARVQRLMHEHGSSSGNSAEKAESISGRDIPEVAEGVELPSSSLAALEESVRDFIE